ncbi:MAG: lipopolysaccharide biosynthesis protein RfbH [Ruminococcaceae bacterium]|nr:lipopolysaccharide biosynthesis protein RfbH [Oscillospiraceae bacterium]
MDKQQILDLVRQYYAEHHIKPPYRQGNRINYAGRVYDADELCALADAALDFWLTAGDYAKRFESELAAYLGAPYCALVCSGSAANLLAVSALTSPLLGERRLRRGDEVISVACGFPTTVTPILQNGAIPVFVDVRLPDGNVDVTLLEEALSEKTRAVIFAHTLGRPFDVAAVKEFCDEHDLWLIEDNCDALGAEVEIDDVWRKTGTIGDIGTSSFYPAHHMTTGEGGAVYTSSPLLHRIVRSMRDWGRDCVCIGGQDNACGHRFTGQFGTLPEGYDHKNVYSHLGYNLKATDLQAAVGTAQLKKLPGFVETRRANWAYLREKLEPVTDRLLFPTETPDVRASWFGFLMTVRDGAGLSRDRLMAHLEGHGIQTRPLFAGNLTRHPCFTELCEGTDYRIVGELTVTDKLMRDSLWIGVYPGMETAMLDEMADRILEYCRKA